MATRKLTTFVRSGRYEGLLEEQVGKSSEGLILVISPLNTIKTFATYKGGVEPYFMMASQKSDEVDTNCYLAVISHSDRLNEEVSERFRKETGIYLEHENKDHKRLMSRMELHFDEFEEDPKTIISTLAGRI